MVKVNFYYDTIMFRNSKLCPRKKMNVVNCFAEGVRTHNDEFEFLDTYGSPADYALILGAIPIMINDADRCNNTLKKIKRYDIVESQKKNNKKVIIIESGLLGLAYNADTKDIKIGSCRVGLNHNLPNFANFKNKNSPSDRWEKLVTEQGLELKPWRTDGEHIIICLQRNGSFAVRDINQIQWLIDTIKEIRKYTDRKIVVRTKNSGLISGVTGVKFSNRDSYLDNAWAGVTMSSTIDIKLVLNGIPVFTTTNRAFTYPLGNHLLSNIEQPVFIDREQFFNDLAYAQWTIKEMKEGAAWSHIKNEE